MSQPRRVYTFVLGHLPDHDLSPNARVHFSGLAAAKSIALEEAFALVREQLVPARPLARAKVTYTFYIKGHRRHDQDNLVASMKAYLDGLVRAGLLADDDDQHVTLSESQIIRDARAEQTVITVEELVGPSRITPT